MRLPTWEELMKEEEQIRVLEHRLDQPLFVAGPPGSGKTVLAMRRAQLAVTSTDEPSVAVVTFNRMLRRLFAIMDEQGLEIRTMHSLVWRDYVNRTRTQPPRQSNDDYAYDWQVMQNTLQETDDNKFAWSHLVVDEAQDLPRGFFRYAAERMGRVLTVFADDDQALSDHRTTLEEIRDATGLGDPIILTRNHRNTPEVSALAEHFHGGRLPAGEVTRSSMRELPRLMRLTDLQAIAVRVANWYRNRGGSIGVIVAQGTTGATVHQRLLQLLPDERVDIYEHNLKNEDEIDVLAPGVTVLNTRSVKGQEFDAVFMLELEHFIPCVDEVARRVMYMMCTRARDYLFLVYGPGDLSPVAENALPGPTILERT